MALEDAYPGLTYYIQKYRTETVTDDSTGQKKPRYSEGQIANFVRDYVEQYKASGKTQEQVDEMLGLSRGETTYKPPTFGEQVWKNSVEFPAAVAMAPGNQIMSTGLGFFEKQGTVVERAVNAIKRGEEGLYGKPYKPSDLYTAKTGVKAPALLTDYADPFVTAAADPLTYVGAPIRGIVKGLPPKVPVTSRMLNPQTWMPTRAEILTDVERILADSSLSVNPLTGEKLYSKLQMGQLGEKKVPSGTEMLNAFSREYFDSHSPPELALDLVERFGIGMTKSQALAQKLFGAHTAGLTLPAEMSKPLLSSGKTLTPAELTMSNVEVARQLADLDKEFSGLKFEGWLKRGKMSSIRSVQKFEELYNQKLKLESQMSGKPGFEGVKVSMAEMGPEDFQKLNEYKYGEMLSPNLLKDFERVSMSPYFNVRSPKEQMIWTLIDEGNREELKYLFKHSQKYLKAVKDSKGGIGSKESFEIGAMLDKSNPQFSSEQTRKAYAGLRGITEDIGGQLVDLGLLKQGDLKQDYLPHMFSRTLDRQTWEKGVREDIASLKIVRNKAFAEGKTLTVEDAHKLKMAEEALERGKSGEVRVMYDYVPQSVYAPYLMKRKGVEGYDLDAFAVMYHYINDSAKKIYREPTVKKALAIAETVEDPGQRSYWKHMLQRYMDLPERERGYMRSIDRLSRIATTLTYIEKMGLSTRSILMNGTQHFNTLVDTGPVDTGKAIYHLFANDALPGYGGKTARELFQESGHALDLPWDWEAIKQSPEAKKFDKILGMTQDVAGKPFQVVEKGNRAVAYTAGLIEATQKGLSGQAATRYADSIVKRTQFLYGKSGAFLAQSNPVGRVAYQFATFPIKSIEMYSNWLNEGPTGVAKAVSHMAVSSAIVHGGTQHLGIDLSYMFGAGIDIPEMIKAIATIKEGDWDETALRMKFAAAPITGNVGGTGMLPSGGMAPGVQLAKDAGMAAWKGVDALIGAAALHSKGAEWDVVKSRLRDAASSEAYRLIPLQGARLYEGGRAVWLGERQAESGERRGYPYMKRGEPEQTEFLLSPFEVATSMFGPKTAHISEVQKKGFMKREFTNEQSNQAEIIIQLQLKGDQASIKRAEMLKDKWNINDPDAIRNASIRQSQTREEQLERWMGKNKTGKKFKEMFFPD